MSRHLANSTAEPPTYRAYSLDANGHIRRSEVLEVGCDDQAQALAAHMASQETIELWDRGRFMGRYGAMDVGSNSDLI